MNEDESVAKKFAGEDDFGAPATEVEEVEESAPPVPAEASTADDASPLGPSPAGVVAAAVDLSKYPASTVQILGAEKALFRALKQRQATPKYGILYHAQLVAKAPAANKGTMSRVLAAKTSLSARIDSFGESEANDAGVEYRAAVEGRLKAFEEGLTYGNSGNARGAGRSFGAAGGAGAGPKRNRVEY